MADVWVGENLGRGRKIFDKNLELRNVSDGAETSTASETGISFDCRKVKEYECVVFVTACDATSGNETYVLTVEVSDLVGGSYTAISSLTLTAASATGMYQIPLNGHTAQRVDDDSDWIRITATLGGTSPSLTYGAFLAKAG